MARTRILLFEDDQENLNKIKRMLETVSKNKIACTPFVGTNTGISSYEDRLFKELNNGKFNDVALIVCDRDLSGVLHFGGLSEVIVSSVASRLGIPVCLYARGTHDFLNRQKEWGDGRIVLKSMPKTNEGALEVIVLVKGFVEIKEKFRRFVSSSGFKKISTPADLLATILGHPEFAEQISLYGSGDQKMLSELFPSRNEKSSEFINLLKKRMPSLFGYWLYNSILRFPGVILNKIALASYLNIDPKHFDKPEVQKLFNKAIYSGPFSDLNEPLWWRGVVDDLLVKSGAGDGSTYVRNKLGREVPPCFCSVDKKKLAGYYCVITHSPISIEKSYGNINWFPRGANLARVSKKIYDEMAPWLGSK